MFVSIELLLKYGNKLIRINLLILIFLSFSLTVQSQINKNGIPLFKNYSPDDYKAHSQNWAIVKDKRGIMYFANNFGLLQFNGSKWQLYPTDSTSDLRSLAVDENGAIYYGASQDFGIVLPDSLGNLKFKSIYKSFNQGNADFNSIWKIEIIKDYAFFQSNEKIFRLKLPYKDSESAKIKENLSILMPDAAFHTSFSVYDKFYAREYDKGLLVFNNDRLKLVPGGELFANEKIYVMLPYLDNKILICSRESGLYIFDPNVSQNAITKFNCKANSLLVQSLIYGGVKISDNRYAISTLTQGVIIIDNLGNVVEQLNMKSGLPDQQIYSIYYDNTNLWFTSAQNGIFKANISSPFREWNKINGLNGVIADVIRFKEKIYVATNNGVFYLDETKSDFPLFVNIPSIPFESWDLLEFKMKNTNDAKLLVATIEGVFEISGNNAIKINEKGFAQQLLQSSIYPNQVYVGFRDGFGTFEFNQKLNKWDFAGMDKDVSKSIKSIYEVKDSKIYLGTYGSGIILINNIKNSHVVIDSTQGLPLFGQDYYISQIDNDVIFASQKGLFVYNENNNKVKPYLNFGNDLANKDLGVYNVLHTEDEYWLSVYSNVTNSIWYDLFRIKPQGNSFVKLDKFAKIIPQSLTLALYNDRNFMWVANEKGLFKFDKTVKKDYNEVYNVNFMKVSIGEDSIIFDGTFYQKKDGIVNITIDQPSHFIPEISYDNNKIVIEYSANFYEEEDKTEYSYRLIGVSDKWSKWTTETKSSFTNLSPRSYHFEIRARNVFGVISNVNSYEFNVLPPWYMTIWAIILFIICAVLFVWIIVKLNIRRLQLDKIKLEGIIDERTSEIRLKNAELEHQKEEITAQRDEIEIQKDKVTFQKDQIEEQKKNITDSILYASKIQEALLPPEHILNELLPEHFIIWRPRDIVSGDFYWTTRKNNKTVLVAADCTGHGVPAAFMSMLGISYLNEIINKFDEIKASEILDELKASVKKALRQTGKDNETKDGMDMALCIIDFENMQMEYAGAYNSLILIRDNTVSKFDADRMPIGIHIKERDYFTNHIIDIQMGDWFYVHSDGYVDQFGGEKGNKLMMKRFKELLLVNHHKSAIEQKLTLENFMDHWVSHKNENDENYKQIDDILVVGFKI